MKKISVAKNQQIIFNHIIPSGAVYGKFTYTYNRKIITGYTFVHDKKKQQIFNKNGTPKMKAVYKNIPTTNTIVYSVESFLDAESFFPNLKFKDGKHLYAWVLFDNSKSWKEVMLGTTPTTKALEKMVRDFIKEHALSEPAKPHVKTKDVRVITPNFRQANQFDPVFRMRPDYLFDMNEDVKPRNPIIHTNMDKLHPVEERSIYVPKGKPEVKRPSDDKPSKVISCRVYHNNNTVTTIK